MTDRIYSIDSVRIIAMAFVVAIHTDPFRGLGATGNMVNFLIDSVARFVVPFFFMTSGYFFARKTARRELTDYFTDRVTTITSLYAAGLLLSAPVFLAGTAVRAGAENRDIIRSSALKLTEFVSPPALLYYGTSVSEILWFLPALLLSLTFVSLFVRIDKTDYLVPISLVFHVIGLLGASYTMFVDIPFEIRDALFFGFFYTSLGYAIYSRDWQPDPERSTHYLVATVMFGVFHLGERYVLGYVLTGETFAQGVYTASYTIGTALFTLSLFLFLLSRPELGRSTPLPSWGNYAVGIYIAHPAVLYPLQRIGEALEVLGYGIRSTLLWHLTLTPLTFFGAALVYVAARRVGVNERWRTYRPRVRSASDRDSS
ncbi:acyltransferase [Haloterrigena sp. H1]|uniref:acyltransferase n=1 Tax=Haloterrigena sp. H1 TaxID=2552943 RepID=UPI00110D5DC7|nr:acyltransferase [Haloterrigena sp. H1]TMT87508.1 acyltransferase [Haloterrigena sp. H1]